MSATSSLLQYQFTSQLTLFDNDIINGRSIIGNVQRQLLAACALSLDIQSSRISGGICRFLQSYINSHVVLQIIACETVLSVLTRQVEIEVLGSGVLVLHLDRQCEVDLEVTVSNLVCSDDTLCHLPRSLSGSVLVRTIIVDTIDNTLLYLALLNRSKTAEATQLSLVLCLNRSSIERIDSICCAITHLILIGSTCTHCNICSLCNGG